MFLRNWDHRTIEKIGNQLWTTSKKIILTPIDFWSNPNPEEPHKWGEYMEDWHDFEWRKEQSEIDCKRKEEEWDRWFILSFYTTTSTAHEGDQIQTLGI